MFRRGLFLRVLGAILLFGLLAVGGVALHRAGVAQGYAIGLATASAETGALPESVPNQVMPYTYARPYGWYGYGPGFHPFGGFGFIFPLFFGLLFFFLITRLIFRPMFGGWGPYTYWKQHGSVPPWAKDWEKGESKGEDKPAENTEG